MAAPERAQLTLAFSGKEPLRDALEDKGFFADLSRWPNVRIEKLRGSDHTLRPVPAQLAARAVLLRGFGAA